MKERIYTTNSCIRIEAQLDSRSTEFEGGKCTYPKTKFIWQAREGILLQKGTNELMYKAQLLAGTEVQ